MSRNLSASALSTEVVGGLVARASSQTVVTQADGSQLLNAGAAYTFADATAFTPTALGTLKAITPVLLRSINKAGLGGDISNLGLGASTGLDFSFPPAISQNGSVFYGATSGLIGFTTQGVIRSPQNGFGSAYVFNTPGNANQLIAYAVSSYQTSTDNGTTWSVGLTITQSGVFNSAATLNLTGSTTATSNGLNLLGYRYTNNAATATTHLWRYNFGARVIQIGAAVANTANLSAASSSDGVNGFNTDASTAVLGTATATTTSNTSFNAYRNGNNGLLCTSGPVNRFTSDGGVTWGAVTGAPVILFGYRFKANGNTPAKMLATTGATIAYLTTNSGQAFTTINLPFGPNETFGEDSVAYRGTIGLIASRTNRTLYVTTNDWTNTTLVTAIAGVTGQIIAVFNDDARLYAYFTSGQIAQTTDGVNWTVRTISGLVEQTGSLLRVNGFAKIGNRAVISLGSTNSIQSCIYTADDAVTWNTANISTTSTGVGSVFGLFAIPFGASGYFAICGRGNSTPGVGTNNSDQIIDGSFGSDPTSYAATTSAISAGANSQFSGAVAYVKLS